MAEAAGLVLGALGIAGLFSACMENFDIVVRGKKFSREFELCCTQLALQRIRLALWGETLGLIPSIDGRPRVPAAYLNRPDIRPAVEEALNHLRALLEDADVVKERFAFRGEPAASSSKGLAIMRDSYERFKTRIRTNQKDKSTWMVTRWAVHDASQFESLITKISGLLDGLEGVTNSLGEMERRQALLTEEIESIKDVESLELLRDATSSRSGSISQRLISDTASVRLSILEGTRPRGPGSLSTTSQSGQSFYTAPSKPLLSLSLATELDHEDIQEEIAGAEVDQVQRESRLPLQLVLPSTDSTGMESDLRASQLEHPVEESLRKGNIIDDIPQNKRVIADLLRKHPSPSQSLSFTSGALDYGKSLKVVKVADEQVWEKKSTRLLVDAEHGTTTARRMFLELRSIRRAGIPFISAAPIGDSLDKILASIEGPPDTPYAGGIFWISVCINEFNPATPPLLRFQTRIYHPNIDSNGNICADYNAWWDDPDLSWYMHTRAASARGNEPWFSERRGNHFALGAVLTSLCGLLASPGIEDPLVPEIAEKYISDYAGYCAAAASYTKMFATGQRPSDDEIVFAENTLTRLTVHDQTANTKRDHIPEVFPSEEWARWSPGGDVSSSRNVRLQDDASDSLRSTDNGSSVTAKQINKRRFSSYIRSFLGKEDQGPGLTESDSDSESDNESESDSKPQQELHNVKPPEAYERIGLIQKVPPRETLKKSFIKEPFFSEPRLLFNPYRWVRQTWRRDRSQVYCGWCGRWFDYVDTQGSGEWSTYHLRSMHQLQEENGKLVKLSWEPKKIWRPHPGVDAWRACCGNCGETTALVSRDRFSYQWFAHTKSCGLTRKNVQK